jgi:PTS system nitrogen regulatory IIA component
VLFAPDAIISDLPATGKKQALAAIADRAAAVAGLDAELVGDGLVARERLGSTSVGRGVAIPHARIEGVDRVFGLFARLRNPIDFGVDADPPVDLLFLLLFRPGAGRAQLDTLSGLAKWLRDGETARRLREASDGAALSRILAGLSR